MNQQNLRIWQIKKWGPKSEGHVLFLLKFRSSGRQVLIGVGTVCHKNQQREQPEACRKDAWIEKSTIQRIIG